MQPTVIIQARMNSTRLPGKVLRPILGRPMLWHVVNRAKYVAGIERVVVATSDQAGDEPIRSFCEANQIECFAGSESDVLDRFYRAACEFKGDPIIRITADCPFVDPVLVGRLLEIYRRGSYDHVGVATGAGALFLDSGRFPDGLDAECFSFNALCRAWREAEEASDREHVTPYLWRAPKRFRVGTLTSERDYSHLRWTVDNEADFELVVQVYEALFCEDKPFGMKDILALLEAHPDLNSINRNFIGSEKYLEVWK